jgi:hypothetical protein
MKAQWKLTGHFHRTALLQSHEMLPTNMPIDRVDLMTLMREIQAVASHHYERSPLGLQQSYGLAMLSESTIAQLLQQANPTLSESQIYQVQGLRWLRPTQPQRSLEPVQSYMYQFVSQESNCQLHLAPNDSQLPQIWQENIVGGCYAITLENGNYPSFVPAEIANHLWQKAQNLWQSCASCDRLSSVMRSSDDKCFSIDLLPRLTIRFTIDDLTPEEQQAVEILRHQDDSAGSRTFWSEQVSNLVNQYQTLGYADNSNVLRQVDIEATDSPLQWIIGRGDRYNRATLEQIIAEAQRFLLISSYVIEDERITRLICEKAATLPEGVWILTDLRDEVVNYLDTQVKNNSSVRFERSHEFKRYCIMNLLNAGVHMRSGRFHLKTIISEQSAYLGSCNLTSGSLTFNLEAGLRVQKNTLHQELLRKFQYYWEAKSQDLVYRTGRQGELMLRSVPPSMLPAHRSTYLLSPEQYYKDLQQELSQFQGQVSIYSRSFKPEIILEQRLLSCFCETRLFIETDHSSHIKSKFKVTPIRCLHAKVTILGDRVAYVGGINFNFEQRFGGLVDLMYKTTHPDEIQQLRYALTRLS